MKGKVSLCSLDTWFFASRQPKVYRNKEKKKRKKKRWNSGKVNRRRDKKDDREVRMRLEGRAAT
jgi:hypothetical protein